MGQPFDPDLLKETERNLRALAFLRKVEIDAVDSSSGALVRVRTWDAWTLEFDGRFSRAGGVTNLAAGVSDRNVLGYGKSMGVQYAKVGETVTRTLEFGDNQLLGMPFVNGSLKFRQNDRTRLYEAQFGRPFYASITKVSVTAGSTFSENEEPVYMGYERAGVVRRRRYGVNGTFGYAFLAKPRHTRRLTASLVQQQLDYASLPGEPTGFIPDSERWTALEIGYADQKNRFTKQKRIQKLSRAEDFNLGLSVQPSLLYAPPLPALGTTSERLVPQLNVRKGFVTELGHFFFVDGKYASTYVNGGNGGRNLGFEGLYFCRYLPRHTAAARLALDLGWRLPADALHGLGEDNGLRGYRARQLIGDRRILFNLEDRIFIAENVGRLLDIGTVVFFDTGNAWFPTEPFSLKDLKSSIGLGLRLAATRSASNVPVRIDLARALSDNQFPSRWTVSIQASQAFGPD